VASSFTKLPDNARHPIALGLARIVGGHARVHTLVAPHHERVNVERRQPSRDDTRLRPLSVDISSALAPLPPSVLPRTHPHVTMSIYVDRRGCGMRAASVYTQLP